MERKTAREPLISGSWLVCTCTLTAFQLTEGTHPALPYFVPAHSFTRTLSSLQTHHSQVETPLCAQTSLCVRVSLVNTEVHVGCFDSPNASFVSFNQCSRCVCRAAHVKLNLRHNDFRTAAP